MAQRLESSFAYSGQLHVKIRGHVSNNLSGGTSDQRKNSISREFSARKTEMDRMDKSDIFDAFIDFVAMFGRNDCASLVPSCSKVCGTYSVFSAS